MVAFPMLRNLDKIPPETRLPVQVQSVELIQCKKEENNYVAKIVSYPTKSEQDTKLFFSQSIQTWLHEETKCCNNPKI